jgi:hypothetical protein
LVHTLAQFLAAAILVLITPGRPDRIEKRNSLSIECSISAIDAIGGILAARTLNHWSRLGRYFHDNAARTKSTACRQQAVEQREWETEASMKAHP